MATASISVTESTVADIAAAVAAGDITPSAVLESYLERIDAVEERVRAWSYLDREGARTQAATLTAEAAAGRLRGPLHGVPVGVKDVFHVAGAVTRAASREAQPEDATPVARLRAAGAIIVGKTHMPIGGRQPPTGNPWNLAHTPGGTSAGSGAAVGARMIPIALGEQTAGSNLRPAAYCGVDGLKPTYGRVSRFGCYPLTWSHDHVGIIGLTMTDIALLLSRIAGPDPRDRSSLREQAPPADLDVVSIRPPRVGVVRNFFPPRTEPIMLEAIEQATARMRAAGAHISDVLLPDDFGIIWMLRDFINGAEGFTFRSRRYAEAPDTRQNARHLTSGLIPASYYLQAQRIRHYLWTRLQESFADLDGLLMGAVPEGAPPGLESNGDGSLLEPWSCVGYPAITVNGGMSPDGLPLGLQLVAPPMGDHSLLRVGAWAEAVLGRLPAPPLL